MVPENQSLSLELGTEIAFFAKHRDDLMRQYPGKFIVLKEERLLGGFDSIQDALGAGVREFGLTSFLVRRTDEEIRDVSIPALSLGILRADPSPTTSGTGTNS
jgi:hypothetical protein